MRNVVLLVVVFFLLSASTKKSFVLEKSELTKVFVYVPENNGFYISKTEVTNAQYRAFLQDLAASGENEKLKEARVDSTKWAAEPYKIQPYSNTYFSHPAYNNYPVVNISKRGAELYCEWLTSKYNRKAAAKVTFRLPTENEWEKSAKGGDTSAIYPWKGNSLYYEKKGQWFGRNLCNARYQSSKSKITAVANKDADITAPVESYFPNAYGIYNMSGNVAEMVSDKNIVKGGSWNSTSENVEIYAFENYDSKPSTTVGFRPVAISK